MCQVNVIVPAEMFDDASEIVIVNWLYGSGEVVDEGEVIAELMAEKATFELPAPASGTLKVLIGEEKPLVVDQVIATIDF